VQIVMVGYKVPASLHPDRRALDFATQVLSATPTGRLHKELVETGLAVQVFGIDWNTHDPGFIAYGAVVRKGEPIEPVRDKLIQVVESSLQQAPPSPEEMERVRRQMETSAERTLNDPQAIGVRLSEYMAVGDWRLFFQFRDAMQTVQAAAVAKAAGRYYRRDNRTVALFIPEDTPQRVEVPAAPSIDAVLKDLKPRAVAAAGEAFDASYANIDARTRRLRIGDLDVALLPKSNRGQTVSVSLEFKWGDAKSLFDREAAAQLTNAMLTRGTPKFSRQQIADERTRLKIQGGLLSFRTDRAHLDEALRFTADLLRESNFPKPEFDQLKREVLADLEDSLNDPDQRAFELLRRQFNTYPKGDPRYVYSTPEWMDEIRRTTLDDVKAFHRDFFGTARGEISVVGDFDAKQIERTLRDAFGGWKSPAPYARILREYADIKGRRLTVNTPDKENAVFRARIAVKMRDDDPDYPALLLANYMFGGSGGGGNRLWDRVREKEGLSYGIGTGLNVDAFSDAGTIGFVAIAAPQNVDRVEQSIKDEIERVRRDGFGTEELAHAKRGLKRERELARAQDGVLAGKWVRLLDADRTFTFDQALEERIDALTLDQVNAAFRKYVAVDRMVIVIGGDAAKGAK
jgi:zinc protease